MPNDEGPCRAPGPDRAVSAPSEKTILLIVPRGVASRFMLQTDILPALQTAGVRVVALTPEGALPHLSPRADASSLLIEKLEDPAQSPPGGRFLRLARAVIRVMRDASLDGRRSPGFAGRYNRIRAAYSGTWPTWISGPVHLAVTQGLWRSARLRQLFSRLDLALSRHEEHGDVLDRYRPDLVVGSGLGYFPHDEALYQEAMKRHIKVAALITGWDNPTTKGYRAVPPDLTVAWSDRMRDDLVELHDLDPSHIEVAGVAHWDPYLRDDLLPTWHELCRELGLDPKKRLVFHAGFPPSSNPEPFEQIATVLASAISEGLLGADLQLVVRLHPKSMSPGHDAARGPYERLGALPNVYVNLPDMAPDGPLRDEPTADDSRVLGGLLKHCAILVNVFSTTTLEGFLLDTPVVMAAPDPDFGRYDANSVSDPRRWSQFVHLSPLVESGAALIAHSPEELLKHVGAYLADPSLDSRKRREVAQLECGPTDGHAGERTAAALLRSIGIPEPG